MIIIVAISCIVVALGCLLPNDFLVYHSYLLYGAQLLTLVPYLARRATFVSRLFLPTLFALVYFLVNETFGSYLIPRGFGWNKTYADVALGVDGYNVIVPYLALANLVLFLVSCSTLSSLERLRAPDETPGVRRRMPGALQVVGEVAALGAFLVISSRDVYSSLSPLLAILIVHLTLVARQRAWYRYGVYVVYLAVFVAYDFDNKREIAMVLFLVLFLESYFARWRLRFRPRNLVAYALAAAAFLALIMTASILRGYGGFEPSSLVDAARLVPQYVRSDLFIDGLTDNLELNYSYGTTLAAFKLTLHGAIPYQVGGSLLKVFFLPIPRDLFADKPASVMQLFTQTYDPEFWATGGSYPVMLPVDMFINFFVFGIAPLALIWIGVDRTFLMLRRARPYGLAFYSGVFLVITVLMLARGSGIEQWLLYYLLALPAFAVMIAVRATTAAVARALARRQHAVNGPRQVDVRS